MININEFADFSIIGKRSSNQDYYGISGNNLFVLCDGVGGNNKGEVASKLVTDAFIREDLNGKALDDILCVAEDIVEQFITDHPDAHGMATTLTVLKILEDKLLIGWVGDSRVYQFRSGVIIFKTLDHSWVNEALKYGIISEEEAINHPKSNVITRAVQGSHKSVELEKNEISDVVQGDYFLLCSDGILESWTDDELSELFSLSTSPNQIIEKIKDKCCLHSKDNSTAIVLKVEEGNQPVSKKTKSIFSRIFKKKKNVS
jgi:serine/threonine protein phosphatase PrpC